MPQPHGVAQAAGLAHAWALDMRAISRSLAQYRTIDLEGKVKKMNEFTGIAGGDLPTLHIFVRKVLISVLIRVRGFPLRDIFSLRALRDGLEQCARVVGTPPPPPSPSFLQVLFFWGKIC